MKFIVKDIDISAGDFFVVVLNIEDARELDLNALDRVRIKKNNRELVSAIDIAEGSRHVKKGELGVFEEVLDKLKIKNKDKVDLVPESKPKSIDYIKKKLGGKKLLGKEIKEIIKDIVDNKLTEIERTYFVSACYKKGLDLNEIVALTNAIVNNSKKLKLKRKIVCDKHSIGGVPGNRTTMIVVPIVTAYGLTMAKTSTKSITSPSGTSDTMKVLADVSFSVKEIERIVKKVNGCMVWGGAMELASADDKLIKIERPLRLDPEGIMLASIMAKKKSVNATHVLIDIPVGREVKIKSEKEAFHLRNKFIKLGKKLGMKVKVIITKGDQPVGNGIGPALEARDVLRILKGEGPKDLREKSLKMAGLIFEMVNVKNGYEKALEILESGKAYEQMKRIIKAQRGNVFDPEKIKLGKFKFNFRAKKNGKISYISNNSIVKIAGILGCPIDKKAGIYLNFKKNDKVKKNNILFTLYAENKRKLDLALGLLKKLEVVRVK